MHNKSVGLLRF